ncbi:MAG: helix-turn-helix transcriptional regulator [Ruminococcaceae bacterium]|jgi:transcriptional regulator with XRE-family HTH domain|nr:helix-turn-helix transcriptional regulator [Oscillospiraceae bacterium]
MAIDTRKLQDTLKERNMTQNELAKLIGVSKSTMSRKVSGESELSVSQAFKMCHVLNIDNPQNIFLP